MYPSPLVYSHGFIYFIESNLTRHLLSWYELLWHSICDRAITIWHRILEVISPATMASPKPPTMAEIEAASLLVDFNAASILMRLKQQLFTSPALPCDDKAFNLRSFQKKQTITLSGPAICLSTGQVTQRSTYTKTIPICLMKRSFFINEAYRARLETVSSTYELQCFLALHTNSLGVLYSRIENGLEKSREMRKLLRKPLPNFPVKNLTPKHIRKMSIGWDKLNHEREVVRWVGQFKYLDRNNAKKLERLGKRSRETWAWILGVKKLIEECETRLCEADKDWVIKKRSERPLSTKQRRWKEGKPGWTGLTPDDIVERCPEEQPRHEHKRLRLE